MKLEAVAAESINPGCVKPAVVSIELKLDKVAVDTVKPFTIKYKYP